MSNVFPPADPAPSRCAGGAQPGAVALMDVLVGVHRESSNLGIYNCRRIAGKVTRSQHAAGTAIDVGYPLQRGGAHPLGWDLFRLVRPHVGSLGVQRIIWDRTRWDRGAPGGVRYTGVSPHTDHLHIELTRSAGRSLTSARVRQVLFPASSVKPPPVPEGGQYTPAQWKAIRRLAAAELIEPWQGQPAISERSEPLRIALLQKGLNVVLGHGLEVTGRFDARTFLALAQFQQFFGVTKDGLGVAGAQTRWFMVASLRNIRDGKA